MQLHQRHHGAGKNRTSSPWLVQIDGIAAIVPAPPVEKASAGLCENVVKFRKDVLNAMTRPLNTAQIAAMFKITGNLAQVRMAGMEKDGLVTRRIPDNHSKPHIWMKR